jgi:hypothetical protein
VHFGIHGTDGSPGVAVVERDEPLHLLFSVTDEARAELNVLACPAVPKNKTDGTRRSALKYDAKLIRISTCRERFVGLVRLVQQGRTTP